MQDFRSPSRAGSAEPQTDSVAAYVDTSTQQMQTALGNVQNRGLNLNGAASEAGASQIEQHITNAAYFESDAVDNDPSLSTGQHVAATAVATMPANADSKFYLTNSNDANQRMQLTQQMRLAQQNAAAAEAKGTNSNGEHALQDYQMQQMLLEQQRKIQLLMARQEHGAFLDSTPEEDSTFDQLSALKVQTVLDPFQTGLTPGDQHANASRRRRRNSVPIPSCSVCGKDNFPNRSDALCVHHLPRVVLNR